MCQKVLSQAIPYPISGAIPKSQLASSSFLLEGLKKLPSMYTLGQLEHSAQEHSWTHLFAVLEEGDTSHKCHLKGNSLTKTDILMTSDDTI